jgi:single-strand DNA-binding protein
MNTVILSGNLVKDAEVKAGDGWQLATFTIAVNESKKKNGEWIKETSFIDCKTFSKKDFNILKRGQGIVVGGKLHQDTWQTKEGKNASKIVVMVDDFQSLESHVRQKQSGQEAKAYAKEDIPF